MIRLNHYELTVAVTQIADYGIFASVADLPEDAVPDTGQIVPAKIEERYTTAATAWLETIDDIDSYAVPVLLPLNSDIQGEVGIEVIDRDDAYLIGTCLARRLNGGHSLSA